jgi:hypothetical protein
VLLPCGGLPRKWVYFRPNPSNHYLSATTYMNDQFEARCQQTRMGLAITTSTSKLGKVS